MHYRRLASFLIGVWIMGSISVGWVATRNFRRVDTILSAPSPGAATMLASLGHDKARMMLRYQASEENREYFSDWELVQIGVGLLLGVTLALGTHVSRFTLGVCGFMLIVVLSMHFLLTPEMVYMGRLLDFTSQDSDTRKRFWLLHGLYSGLELLKLLSAFVLAGYLFLFRPQRTTRSATAETETDIGLEITNPGRRGRSHR